MYFLWRYIRNPATAEARATPRGTPKPMPILDEELKADDTASEVEALDFEEAAAMELANDELADPLLGPLDVVVLPLAVDVVREDLVVGPEVGVAELAAVDAERCVAALATELAFCVAELATARAAEVALGTVSSVAELATAFAATVALDAIASALSTLKVGTSRFCAAKRPSSSAASADVKSSI